MTSRIGFITIGHQDYVNKSAEDKSNEAVGRLKEKGIDVIYESKIVTDRKNAIKTARNLIKKDVQAVIVFLGTWMECPVAMAAIREFEHLPFALWGFQMFEKNGRLESTGSFVSFAMFKGSLTRMNYNFKSLLGSPEENDIINQAVIFCKAASTKEKLKRTVIGLVGYTSMGIYPGTFDHVMLRKKIGPEIDHLDTYTLINRLEKIPDNETEEIINYLRKTTKINDDVSKNDLLTVSKMYLAMKKLSQERDFDAINIKCQYELSKEYGMVACVPLSILSENGIVSSCEGDIPNTVSMVILNYLSGKITGYGDIININDDGTIKLSPCGFIPFSLGVPGQQKIRKFMPGVGFSGIQNAFVFKPGKVTLLRLVEDCCDYHLVYLIGKGKKTKLRQGYMPALDIEIDGSIKKMVDNFAGQHYAICYGDLSKELEQLAILLNIDIIKI
ncbi:MAG: hypothetical protein V5A68_03875 [Candidatus Thermoplasmatota archaeon]